MIVIVTTTSGCSDYTVMTYILQNCCTAGAQIAMERIALQLRCITSRRDRLGYCGHNNKKPRSITVAIDHAGNLFVSACCKKSIKLSDGMKFSN